MNSNILAKYWYTFKVNSERVSNRLRGLNGFDFVRDLQRENRGIHINRWNEKKMLRIKKVYVPVYLSSRYISPQI